MSLDVALLSYPGPFAFYNTQNPPLRSTSTVVGCVLAVGATLLVRRRAEDVEVAVEVNIDLTTSAAPNGTVTGVLAGPIVAAYT